MRRDRVKPARWHRLAQAQANADARSAATTVAPRGAGRRRASSGMLPQSFHEPLAATGPISAPSVNIICGSQFLSAKNTGDTVREGN